MTTSTEVLVRIAVGMGVDGKWVAVGDGSSSEQDQVGFLRAHAPFTVTDVYWVEATIPIVTRTFRGALALYNEIKAEQPEES